MRKLGAILVLVAAIGCGGGRAAQGSTLPASARPSAVPLALDGGGSADQLVFDVRANRAVTNADRTADIALVLADELCEGRSFRAEIEVTVELADGSTRTNRLHRVSDCETVLAQLESVELAECDAQGCGTQLRVNVRALESEEPLDLSLYASATLLGSSEGEPHVDATLTRVE